MKDETRVEHFDELLPSFCSTVAAMTHSLHARKWASINNLRGTISTTSGAQSLPLYEEESENTEQNNIPNIEASESIGLTASKADVSSNSLTDLTDFELSSKSKRKLSREPAHGLIEESTRGFNDLLAGITGFDLSDTEIDGNNAFDVFSNSDNSCKNSTSETPRAGFMRRNTRRITGPSGEKIILHTKKDNSTMTRSTNIKCLLDVEANDHELFGFVEKVLDASNLSDGSNTEPDGGKRNGKDISLDRSHHSPELFEQPVLTSTLLYDETNQSGDEDSLDSSENSPSITDSPGDIRHMSFASQDLPLYANRVAPIPRILDLQQNSIAKRLDDGTTTYTDSEDMYSSQHSSQNDLMNSILPPIHSQHVKSTLHKEEEPDFEELERYFPNHQMSLFIGTWNMHSEKDVPLLVEEFLMPPECEFLQDIYVIGTQECTPHKREWEVTVQATLGPTHVLVRSESLGDIHLIILVRREMIWIIRDVQSSTVACGAGGVMRNKGAVGIILTIFGSSMLFITAHLRAHSSKVKERNYDSSRIASSLDFSRYDFKTENSDKIDTLDCTDKVDCVFWFGDLNYRVTCERDVAQEAIQSDNIEPLLMNDQLLQQINSKLAFRGFTEAAIKFPPTFKFDPGSVEYDTSPKQRVPSWTDRILYKSRQDSITPQIYHYCPCLTFSDHRPVFGVYLVTLKPSPISSTIRATGWFDKRAYARGMKRRQMYPKAENSSLGQPRSPTKLKQSSFVYKAVNAPVKKVIANHKNSLICSVM